MPVFSHLHNHTQYSLLDGASSIEKLMVKAKEDGMPAIAITDHGNMFGVFNFVNAASKSGVKAVVGCEFYLVKDRFKKQFTRGDRDVRYHQLLLAKNQAGYSNLSKLCSLGYLEGLYGKFPRIDKELLSQYKEGLIATTCCLGAEVPRAIVGQGEEAAEAIFKEWLDLFGDDYYIELQRHQIENIDGSGISQEDVNQILLKWSKKYNVPVIATNDSHYVDEDDYVAHDILLCVNTGELQSTPKGHGQGYRFGFENSEFYFKTQKEMEALFSDIPEALDNTNLIVDKITSPELKRDVLLPNFTLPPGFENQQEYLRFLTLEGAKKRYQNISLEIEERINFELNVINESGYPGYFLIVQDFTTAAREMDVWVGPGRGSAAGSVVAYCLGITNVDPISYNLLFERFLNPERISMPDIDIDFDDEGRQKVIDYVIDKYGKKQVSQIITYGTMAARSSIRDVGRVMDVPLSQVGKIAESFPKHLSATLNKVLDKDEKLQRAMNADDSKRAEVFRKMATQQGQIGDLIQQAKQLEGSIRNTGVHACGVIITPDDMMNYVPLAVAKDSDLALTQFDNNVVEHAGLLKMDFLGLKTLTIIKDAIALVKENYDIDIDPDLIPLDDKKTYGLFQKGNTGGIFQYESAGMRKHLRALKPNEFSDLIAMNALYRPGPMKYIPEFIDRKHGRKEIRFDLADMEEILAETYGITVYQEQVMLLSQKLADFTKGEADMLRKGMGKKKKSIIDELYPKFMAGCKNNGHSEVVVDKIWKDWEAFASYAFNKSHSTCYALLGYQTAYLKANYPSEFMASVLTHNMSDLKKVTFFMEQTRRAGVEVLGPDVNESVYKFNVNADSNVRFGLGAVKGVGKHAVLALVEERNENGPYKSVFDLTSRVSYESLNKKTLEGLALSGAFDCFPDSHRAQYFFRANGDGESMIEKAIKYGQKIQKEAISSQQSLFGSGDVLEIKPPRMPEVEPWSKIEELGKERDTVGVFISGHPLDGFKLEFQQFTNTSLDRLMTMKDKVVKIAGVVNKVQEKHTKKGDRFAIFSIEDYHASMELQLFSETYNQYRYMINEGEILHIEGKYQQRWKSEGEYSLRIQKINRLDGMMKQFTKGLCLQLKAKQLKPEFIDKMEEIVSNHEGETPLHFQLFNGEGLPGVSFLSRSKRIALSKRLLDDLEELGDFDIRLLN